MKTIAKPKHFNAVAHAATRKENPMNARFLMHRVLVAAALVAGTAARADLVSVGSQPLPAVASPAPAVGAQIDGWAFALAAGRTTAGTRLTETAAAVGSLTAPNAGTVNLWTFITAVRAQQRGESFTLLETQLSLFDLVEPTPAPVPLPAAAWFLVMGLLGAAGVRLTGRSTQPGAAPAGLVPVPG